jgi:subtilisin family serine protease
MSIFKFLKSNRPSSIHETGDETFILEPLLTPMGLVDASENSLDIFEAPIELNTDDLDLELYSAEDEIATDEEGFTPPLDTPEPNENDITLASDEAEASDDTTDHDASPDLAVSTDTELSEPQDTDDVSDLVGLAAQNESLPESTEPKASAETGDRDVNNDADISAAEDDIPDISNIDPSIDEAEISSDTTDASDSNLTNNLKPESGSEQTTLDVDSLGTLAEIEIENISEPTDTTIENSDQIFSVEPTSTQQTATVTTAEIERETEAYNLSVSTQDITEKPDTTTEDTTTKEEPELETEAIAQSRSEPIEFTSGVFEVGNTGEVEIDFLFDGGHYRGELAIFSLEGLEEFTPGSEEFIQAIAERALSSSELGHVAISDASEGARFSGSLEKRDHNSGDYIGAKTFQMKAGSQFGVMLVPDGSVQQVAEGASLNGKLRPLFSMATANPDDGFHVGQLADVTGTGHTFTIEDQRVDRGSDFDYNDLVFQFKGASGRAEAIRDLIADGKDWSDTEIGRQLLDYVTPEEPEQPDTPPTNEQPEEPEQPDTPPTNEQPEEPEQPDTPPTNEQPEEPEQPDTPPTNEQPEEPEQPDTPPTNEQPEEPEQPDTPPTDERLEQARKINVSTAGETYTDRVTAAEPSKYYSFSFGATNDLDITISRLTAEVEVRLLDSAGKLIKSVQNNGNSSVKLEIEAPGDSYRIQVLSKNLEDTTYEIDISSDSKIPGLTKTGSFEKTISQHLSRSLPLIRVDDFQSGEAWRGSRPEFANIDGQGFAIAVIDSGIDSDHPSFGGNGNGSNSPRIVHQADFVNNDTIAEDDTSSHGTHVASIAAGSTGVAPGANILALKVFDNDDLTTDNDNGASSASIELALRRVIDRAERDNIVAVNLSLGSGNFDSFQELWASDEIKKLNELGVIVVASSGNDFIELNSQQGVTSIAADPNTISVGSVWAGNFGTARWDINDDGITDVTQTTGVDRITAYTQRHPELLDIFAPGDRITAARADSYRNPRNPNVSFANTNGFIGKGGTSMAAPHIAGMVALAQQLATEQLGRTLSPQEFRQLLTESGEIINDGDDESDSVNNSGADYRRADMLALANSIMNLRLQPAWEMSAAGQGAGKVAVGRNQDGRLEAFVVGPEGILYHSWQTQPNGGWSPWIQHKDSGMRIRAKSVTIASNADGRLQIFAIGRDSNNIYTRWQTSQNGSWSRPEHLLGGTARDIAVGKNADGRLEIFKVGMDNNVYQAWQKYPNGSWTGWRQMSGKQAKSISVGRNEDGRQEVFIIGTDDKVYQSWQKFRNGSWSDWHHLSNGRARDLVVGQNADGRQAAFIVGLDRKVYSSHQEFPNGTWSDWKILSRPNTLYAKSLAVGRNKDGRLEVFAQGLNDKIYQVWQTKPNGNWSNRAQLLDSGSISDLAVSQNKDGRLEVFTMTGDNKFQQAWQTSPNSNWAGWNSETLGSYINVRVDRVKGDFDSTRWNDSDFYTRVQIGSNQWWQSPTKGGSNDYRPSNWSHTRYVRGETVPINIQLFDSDGGFRGGDDHIDIDPNPSANRKDLNLTYNLRTNQITGDRSGWNGQQIYSSGGKGEIWVTINENL